MLELGVYGMHSGRRGGHPSIMRDDNSPAGMLLGTPPGMVSRGHFMSAQQLWRTANKIPKVDPVPDACHLNDA